jgi:DMSO/TMAO reductase YedYZ molybdopterin-dependent catalytic subunit
MTVSVQPLSSDPFVRPVPLEALAQSPTPSELHFRRDHFSVPELDTTAWTLEIGGAVAEPLRLGLEDLKALPHLELAAVLECAGHRRAEFQPPARGVAWGLGALSEARWGGVSLTDVLKRAGVERSATAAVLTGADRGRFEDWTDVPFARALPLAKALHPDTLLAWELNGEALTAGHGAPVRAVVPGWYATDSVKWLVSIELIAGTFDGPFEAFDYRLPDPDGGSHRMTDLPVHAILTAPREGAELAAGRHTLRGVAWGGQDGIARVEVSVDRGAWAKAELAPGSGPYALTRWQLEQELTGGAHELAVRATDGTGTTQPDAPAWNPQGYANASVHRATVVAL